MVGINTQFEILRLTLEKLDASGDPGLTRISRVMKDNSAYAHLGAIGPAIGDFIPSDPLPSGSDYPQDYSLVWKMIFGLMGGELGLYESLSNIRKLLDQIQTIADAEDNAAICQLKDSGFEEKITTASENFFSIVNSLQSQALSIVTIIGGMKPKVSAENPTDPIPPPNEWDMRDFLHWKRTGKFVDQLIKKAIDKSDDRLLAYAYGYLVSYSGNACGSPFVNSAVGGPPRTQWWRHRFVNNFIDSWVYGYYNSPTKPMYSGDIPNPAYSEWPNISEANLQEKIHLEDLDPIALMNIVKTAQPFQEVLPPDFCSNWFEAFQDTYDPPYHNDRFNPGTLNSAYLMTWLVLWFQTSGQVIGFNLSEPMTPPDSCGDAGSSLDPFQSDPVEGGPTLPPSTDVDYEENTALKVCGIIMAILGGAIFLAGGLVTGAVLIGGAVSVLDCESLVIVDWKDLRCKLYWFRIYLHNGEKGLQKLMKFAGFMYPLTKDLATDEDVLSVLGVSLPFESGKNLVKSRVDRSYPSKPWDGGIPTFNNRPNAIQPGVETPTTTACMNEVYPDFFIDNTGNNPLTNGDIKTGPVTFPNRLVNEKPVQFGNAVDNAVDVFKNLSSPKPNWNLDSDRGLTFVTWQFDSHYDPDNVQIKPES